MLAPGGAQTPAPYLLQDGAGRFLWTVSDMHHEAFTYIIAQAIAAAAGEAPVLAAPALAHIWSGRQTFALAYAPTELALNLPFAAGEAIDLTIYDARSELQRRERGIPYAGPLRVTLDRYALLVVESAR